MPKTPNELLLEDFLEIEREKIRAGSGDDMFYEQQIIDFMNKHKWFLIELVKFVRSKNKHGKNT